jgi:hypothetical protein
MSNKPIILSLLIFLILSFGFLAYTETKQQSPASQDWWVVYFVSPKDNSLNFVIENNSNQTKFHYEVLADNSKLKEADIQIAKGVKKEIDLAKSDFANLANKKISITVVADNEKKEIYKSL